MDESAADPGLHSAERQIEPLGDFAVGVAFIERQRENFAMLRRHAGQDAFHHSDVGLFLQLRQQSRLVCIPGLIVVERLHSGSA